VFVGLMLVPAPTLLLGLAAASIGVQIRLQRPWIKALYNAASSTLSVGAAAAASVALAAAGWPLLACAIAGIAAYSLASNGLVAVVLSVVGKESLRRVVRSRLTLPTLAPAVLGVSVGISLYALQALHPAAILAILPFVYFGSRYVGLYATAERELLVRDRLGVSGDALNGTTDLDEVARHVLTACGEIFQPASAEISAAFGEGAPRRWGLEFDALPGDSSLEVEIVGRGGSRLGTLRIVGRKGRARLGESDTQIARVVAGQAASAIERALALQDLLDLRGLHDETMDHAPTGIGQIAADGAITYLNPHLCALVGGRDGKVWDLPAFAAHPTLPRDLRRLLDGKTLAETEVRVEHDASPRTLLVAGVPILRQSDGGQAVRGAVMLVQDITGRKEAEEAMRAQSLARPLVRRIVEGLTGRSHVMRTEIVETGRAMAAEIPRTDAAGYAQAFRTMGLGSLHVERIDGKAYTFAGDDLLERREKSTQPTCALTLGFLEGAVARLHESAALGTELRCQSQGHPRCVFVVKPRAVVVQPRARRVPAAADHPLPAPEREALARAWSPSGK
ncbi:MAG TPA: V4R domain-containing protein, partial [Candidatus Thermoplasmatota archaeon]|nr:V4R domain-containing protein [Candidatus Thermoplasmatota archaeon]